MCWALFKKFIILKASLLSLKDPKTLLQLSFCLQLLFFLIWGHFLVVSDITKRVCRFVHFMNKNVRDKPEKWETSFVTKVSKSKIGNKFQPPKSSMGTLFQPRRSKNRSFFTKKYPIPSIWVPQQHHLSQQHFGGHVA